MSETMITSTKSTSSARALVVAALNARSFNQRLIVLRQFVSSSQLRVGRQPSRCGFSGVITFLFEDGLSRRGIEEGQKTLRGSPVCCKGSDGSSGIGDAWYLPAPQVDHVQVLRLLNGHCVPADRCV